MGNILELDITRSWRIETRIAINSSSTSENGRRIISSTCVTRSELEYWLTMLESDIVNIRRQAAEVLKIHEKRDLYGACFEFKRGGIATFQSYADTADEFFDDLYNRNKTRPFRLLHLHRMSRNQYEWLEIEFYIHADGIARAIPSMEEDTHDHD